MTISKDLFLAILSMDSYNRGYGEGIKLTGNTIGSATISSQSDIANDSEEVAAGFYAVAYTVGAGVTGLAAGTTVISYRGTDDFNPFTDGNDVLNGWVTGLGYAADQANLAEIFYETVTNRDLNGSASTDTILTGHSLGGGLAGYIPALTGTSGVGFDHMPFGVSAWLRHLSDVNRPLNKEPEFGAFKGIHTTGEALQFLRDGASMDDENGASSCFPLN
jgi:hypothetical protein